MRRATAARASNAIARPTCGTAQHRATTAPRMSRLQVPLEREAAARPRQPSNAQTEGRCHDCAMIHGPDVNGHGRCAVRSNMEDIVRERVTLDSLAHSIYPSEASKNRMLWITNRSKASNRSKERQHATQSKCRLARRPQDGQRLDFHR